MKLLFVSILVLTLNFSLAVNAFSYDDEEYPSSGDSTYYELMDRINVYKKQEGLREDQPLFDAPARAMYGKGVDDLSDSEFKEMMIRIRTGR